jgi:hypothetical protein
MIIRKLTCLLLALVFLLTMSAPVVLADDTPPGDMGGEIHPWDNTDRIRHSDDAPATTRASSPRLVIGWTGFGGRIVVSIALPASWSGNWQKETRGVQRGKSSVRALRTWVQSR